MIESRGGAGVMEGHRQIRKFHGNDREHSKGSHASERDRVRIGVEEELASELKGRGSLNVNRISFDTWRRNLRWNLTRQSQNAHHAHWLRRERVHEYVC